MRTSKIGLLVIFASHALCLADPVDTVTETYQNKINDGILKLRKLEMQDLEKVKADAMRANNLETAKKADDRIKILTAEASKNPATALTAPSKYPANESYRMFYANGAISSEHGHEIVCRFQRVSKLDIPQGVLNLVLRTDASAYSNSPNDILILNGSKGKEIGRIKGVGTNKVVKIPLLQVPAETMEIVVVNYGNEAVRLKSFSDGVPELFLEYVK